MTKALENRVRALAEYVNRVTDELADELDPKRRREGDVTNALDGMGHSASRIISLLNVGAKR